MTTLAVLTAATAQQLAPLHLTDSIPPAYLPEASKFDNRTTWDNTKPAFDNRPTWDNWTNKR